GAVVARHSSGPARRPPAPPAGALASARRRPHNGSGARPPLPQPEQEMTGTDPRETLELPVLPLRDVVVFPHMVIPLFVGREKSIRALDAAVEGDKQILLVAQKSADIDDPGASDLHKVGTLAQVLQLLKLPDG